MLIIFLNKDVKNRGKRIELIKNYEMYHSSNNELHRLQRYSFWQILVLNILRIKMFFYVFLFLLTRPVYKVLSMCRWHPTFIKPASGKKEGTLQ